MSKLFTLKKWFTLADAARHLARILNEDVKVLDVLQLSLDGRLKLSVRFVHEVNAYPGCIFSAGTIDVKSVIDVSMIDDRLESLFDTAINLGENRYAKFSKEVVRLSGTFDLPLVGSERSTIEGAYHDLVYGKPLSTKFTEGAFVEGPDGTVYLLCDHLDNNEIIEGSSANVLAKSRLLKERNLSAENSGAAHMLLINQQQAFIEKMDALEQYARYRPIDMPIDAIFIVRSKNFAAFLSTLDEAPKPPVAVVDAFRSSPKGQLMTLAIEVQKRYWGSNFDPANRSTWTSQETILEWIRSQCPGISDFNAKAVEKVACPIDRGAR